MRANIMLRLRSAPVSECKPCQYHVPPVQRRTSMMVHQCNAATDSIMSHLRGAVLQFQSVPAQRRATVLVSSCNHAAPYTRLWCTRAPALCQYHVAPAQRRAPVCGAPAQRRASIMLHPRNAVHQFVVHPCSAVPVSCCTCAAELCTSLWCTRAALLGV